MKWKWKQYIRVHGTPETKSGGVEDYKRAAAIKNYISYQLGTVHGQAKDGDVIFTFESEEELDLLTLIKSMCEIYEKRGGQNPE